MHTATITIPLADTVSAAAVHAALLPEMAEGPEGTHTALEIAVATIHATIQADDLSGLRAAINSVVRLLDAAARVA